jgi:hypothetical protein
MDSSVTLFLLLILATVSAISLFMNIKLFFMIASLLNNKDRAEALPIGELVPYFSLKFIFTNKVYHIEEGEFSPFVMVFLSPSCMDCKNKLPELAKLKNGMQHAGVRLFVIGLGKERQIKRFLKGNGLDNEAAVMEKPSVNKLNPLVASPFYLFVDDAGIVVSSATIGDENWLEFSSQMNEYEQAS